MLYFAVPNGAQNNGGMGDFDNSYVSSNSKVNKRTVSQSSKRGIKISKKGGSKH